MRAFRLRRGFRLRPSAFARGASAFALSASADKPADKPGFGGQAGGQVLGAALAAFFVVASAPSGSAGDGELPCGGREEILAALASDYGERRIAAGISKNSVVELYASEGGRTWTLLVTVADSPGVSCLIGAGTDWDDIVTPAGDPA
ncbi:MAG: hypothetical protein ACOY3L_03720 [Pseudomonadota bacterium]